MAQVTMRDNQRIVQDVLTSVKLFGEAAHLLTRSNFHVWMI